MFSLNSLPNRTCIVNEKEFLFFSGYAYLGMQHNNFFVQKVKEGIDTVGWLFPSSRISNTQLTLYTEFENMLSNIVQMQYTTSFASGFGAGTVAATLFKNNVVSICPNAHPAVNKIEQPFLTFDKWAEKTLHYLHKNSFENVPVLIADAVNPITAEINDFGFLQYIDKPVVVIIDDSHGIGLIGNNGNGITQFLPKQQNIEYIITYSLSKAFGIQGGAISCNNINYANAIKNMPEFCTSTALPPAFAYAFIHSQNEYAKQRILLQNNIAGLKKLLGNKDCYYTEEQLPIFILPEHLNQHFFEQNGIIISSFAYPKSTGKIVNRIVVNALHTLQDLEQLAYAINSIN